MHICSLYINCCKNTFVRWQGVASGELPLPARRRVHLNLGVLRASTPNYDAADPKKVDVSKADSSTVRSAMMEYWKRWENTTTESGTHFENMVGEGTLARALEMAELDQREVFSLLPDMSGMTVLELAAGVG